MAVRFSVNALVANESGATAVEYGLIVAGIFLAIVSAMSLFAGNATTMYNMIATTVGAATH
jgi:pilus assembly protein Flp/PilA